jgi:hypothetical protein
MTDSKIGVIVYDHHTIANGWKLVQVCNFFVIVTLMCPSHFLLRISNGYKFKIVCRTIQRLPPGIPLARV